MRLTGTTAHRAHRAQIAAATAAAAAEAEAEAEGAPVEWAQCDEEAGCGKWRVLPAHVRAATLPDCFVCSMGHWLPGTPSCLVPADEPEEVAAVVVVQAVADDTAATSGGEEVAQVKSMFKFGSGKHATVKVKALELSRRTLADGVVPVDKADRVVPDFVSGGRASDPRNGFADPEWELPEFIAKREELLASWRETDGFRTGSVNPYYTLRNKMNEAIFISRWEREHFGRCLRTRERQAVEKILASIQHFQGQLGLSKTGMLLAALQARLSNKAAPPAPLPQSAPVTTNKCTRAAAAQGAMGVCGDSLQLSMWKDGPSVRDLIGTISLSKADEGLVDVWIKELENKELEECHPREDPFHREDVNGSCLSHLIYPSSDGTFCKMILLLKDVNQQHKVWQLAQLLPVSWREAVRRAHDHLHGTEVASMEQIHQAGSKGGLMDTWLATLQSHDLVVPVAKFSRFFPQFNVGTILVFYRIP